MIPAGRKRGPVFAAPSPSRQPTPELRGAVERIAAHYFQDFPLLLGDNGAVTAQFFRSRLTSAFQPMVDADDRRVVGHQAVLRVESRDGESVAPWSIYAHAVEDPALVQLDRLCRTVHALNYFPWSDPGEQLFLNVESRLLSGVSADHGAYFEAILALLGVAPARVVIVMPPDAVERPVSFVRAAIAYRARGYRVMVPVASVADTELSHVFLAAPHYVSIEFPAALEDATWQPFLQALSRHGIEAVARRIESEPQAQAARRAGARLLQGFHVGRP